MLHRIQTRLSNPSRWRSIFLRWTFKSLFFVCLSVVVLNPNLRRAFQQVDHTLEPERLIQTNFQALPCINAQIDRYVRSDGGRRSEARLVAKFVLKKIKYISDYENWGNLDYWPTAEEVWQKRQEDCDGRAILAASILRSRGFHSAALAVGLDHMWVIVDENETNPSKPAHLVALLSPNPDFSMELNRKSKFEDFLCLARAFLHPTAFRDTSTHLFADIPSLRKAILIVAFLLLCCLPSQHRTGVLAVVALGLVSANFLVYWDPDKGSVAYGIAGAIFFSRPWYARS